VSSSPPSPPSLVLSALGERPQSFHWGFFQPCQLVSSMRTNQKVNLFLFLKSSFHGSRNPDATVAMLASMPIVMPTAKPSVMPRLCQRLRPRLRQQLYAATPMAMPMIMPTILRSLMWLTPIIVDDLFWCRLIYLVKIFSTLLMMSSSEFRYVFRVFIFFIFLSPLFLSNLVFSNFTIWENSHMTLATNES